MDTYETDHDTLEDVLYRRLESLWAPFTDTLKVFQKHNASQPRCAQKVWEALLTDFPLDPVTSTCRGEVHSHGGTQPCIQAKSTRHPRGCVGRSPTIFFIFFFL
jgi:hypothetical protein